MGGSKYLYNNEAIACVAIGYLLRTHKMLPIAKLVLILPFVLHEPTCKKLRGRSNKRSLEEFILKNPECVMNFSARYLDFLPLSINAVTILYEMGVINIKGNKVHYNHSSSFHPERFELIGQRARNIFPALDSLHEIMQSQDVNSFYLKLNIVI